MLLKIQLEQDLRKVLDSKYKDYSNPKNKIDIVNGWSYALNHYYQSMVLPISGNINIFLERGIQIFKVELLLAIESGTVLFFLEKLITKLHNIVISGVTATGLWITIPPVLILNLQACFSTNKSNTSELVCNKLASTIDIWIRSTNSTQIGTGTIAIWS